MANVEFKLPELGEDIEEADVLKVLVSEGDTIEVDQALIEIETEKATLEVPSASAGKVTKIHVREGDTIKVGQLIFTIEPGTAAETAPKTPPAAAEAAPTRDEPKEEQAAEPALAPEAAGENAARAPAEPESAQLEAPRPTEAPAASEKAEAPAAQPAPAPASGEAPVFASPSQRKFAREVGVDLTTVKGSGPGGRITEEDVKLASRNRPAHAPTAPPSPDGVRTAQEFRHLPGLHAVGRRDPRTAQPPAPHRIAEHDAVVDGDPARSSIPSC